MPKTAKSLISCKFFSWNLFRRDGVFYADGRRNKPNLGKHSLSTRDREQALKAIGELDRRKAIELNFAQETPQDNYRPLSIPEGWRMYLEYCNRPSALGGVGASTDKRYRAVRDKHQKFCGERGIISWDQIDKNSITAYATHLKKIKYSDNSVYLECTLLKQLVKWLIEEDKSLPDSHRIRLRLIRSEESDTYCYSPNEVSAMIECCRGKLSWLSDIITALACTGMRIGELISMRPTDVDLGTGMINVPDNRHSGRAELKDEIRTTKGKRSRRIPIHSNLRPVLQKLVHSGHRRVFTNSRGRELKADVVRNILIRDVLNPLKSKFPTSPGEIRFEHGRLHSFRHFFVSQAFLGGASEGEIREWVGHRDSRIVERYRHLRSEDARRKMDQLNLLGTISNQTIVDSSTSAQTNNQTSDAEGLDVPIQTHPISESEVPESSHQQPEIRAIGESESEAA
jgi:integrase